MRVKSAWRGTDALGRDFDALARGMQGQALRGALRAAAKVVVDKAKRDSPSRRVRRALAAVVGGPALTPLGRIGARRKTAGVRLLHLIEHGTAPHMIRARHKRVLASGKMRRGRFRGTVFGMTVNHPGAKAQPFFVAALETQRAEIRRKFLSALGHVIDNLKLRMLKRKG